jgi:glycosyltransferase involved in cell wall biosynthesis
MNVLVNAAVRFSFTADGQFWSPYENSAYVYWTRFLDVFDEVTILARAFPTAAPPKGAQAASGPGVNVIALPNYHGIWEFAREYPLIRKLVHRCVSPPHAICLSLPCVIADVIWRSLPPARPFAVGVCGDPYDLYAPNASKHPLRPLFRWYFSRLVRLQCSNACACTYVTKNALQRRYPCKQGSFCSNYSSIHLPREAIAEQPLTCVKRSGQFHLVYVGTLETWYKGCDTLLSAVSLCRQAGIDVRLTLIGDGRVRPAAEMLSEKLGIASHVRFMGQLPFSAAVRAELDSADLFVLPSRTEGLPKALIEAMARGLPCIATCVGGIPELLSSADLAPPDDPKALSARISEVLADPERRLAMSARNLIAAREYCSDVLRQRRIEFYQVLRTKTAEWLKDNNVPRRSM